MGRRLSSRFVAGMHTDEALHAAAALNDHGISVTLDSLGENVHSPDEAHRSAAIYHELLDAIHERHLDANVSVKLTQMGMDLDPAAGGADCSRDDRACASDGQLCAGGHGGQRVYAGDDRHGATHPCRAGE